ncbi:hypothetical protein GE300_16215 [Rhodobacteraceae bacterium 2CG4]|uniref:Uncharacterized protein n=1 Tax=Halovulum marinum TaxID=2662447 RepID=A0A6L5Z524_9RHOB|nr:hypothetical protein [Halovulum marinum]MSU91134.1 hypothetical protein [Halovulum marinum]
MTLLQHGAAPNEGIAEHPSGQAATTLPALHQAARRWCGAGGAGAARSWRRPGGALAGADALRLRAGLRQRAGRDHLACARLLLEAGAVPEPGAAAATGTEDIATLLDDWRG